ncbi:NAD(P)-binding domain-containing protein [Oceanimonas sp. NS1]|nr:NAD(P)-binding domain-containing protein [Oceanimonas sp. NS1]
MARPLSRSGVRRSEPGRLCPQRAGSGLLRGLCQKFNAPVRTGVEVKKVTRNADRPGFTVDTSIGEIQANRVVAATGPFQRPAIPPIAPKDESLHQIHSSQYRNPGQLPEGAIMVVGAGSSGVQIADELQRAGKTVYLSVGPHDRPPAPTVTATSAGGWVYWANGMPRP